MTIMFIRHSFELDVFSKIFGLSRGLMNHACLIDKNRMTDNKYTC